MINERKLIEEAIKMNSKISDIRDFYPELSDNILIKKLLSISDNFGTMFNQFIHPGKE